MLLQRSLIAINSSATSSLRLSLPRQLLPSSIAPSLVPSIATIVPPNPLLHHQQRPATKKSGGSSANGRTSNPKFLGLKRGAGARVSHPGQIIIRQRGTQWHPGPGVGCGRDHTLYATRAGWVVFSYDLARQRRVVWVAERWEDVAAASRGAAGSGEGNVVGFGSRTAMRERLANAIDAKEYLQLDGLGRWKYVLETADRLVKEDEAKKAEQLSKKLEGQTRGSFNLVDLTML